MSKIAITDYFNEPSDQDILILGDLISCTPTEETEVLMVWHQTIDGEFIEKFPKLRGVQRYGVGFDNLDLKTLKAKGIVCANNPDYGVDEVSDTAIAFIMSATRGVIGYDIASKAFSNTWQENVNSSIKRSSDTLVATIGAGRIGSSVLQKCNAIGFQTGFIDPFKESGHEKVVRSKRFETLESLLSQADVVSLHCPLSDETRGIVDSAFISKMKKGAILVNTARGGLVDDLNDIYHALKSNQLSAVYLDVIPNEPPKNEPLIEAWRKQEDWIQGRLIINPHTSYFSDAALRDMKRTAAENALRMYLGQPPKNLL